MAVFFGEISVKTVADRPSYHQLTKDIEEKLVESQIRNGICLVQTAHTTCSIYFDEYMHDKNYYNDDYLQVDLNNVLHKFIPRQTTENIPYLSPGPKHIEYGMQKKDPDYPAVKWTMLNTDGHLRSDILGNSVTLGIKNNQLMNGEVGSIFFVDFDQTRERNRKIQVIILGEG
ncbi:YjbQ family protein [Tetragenococcus halophilus]|uniref:YjbQ family protein n=1 Tax=Tetragenococcus halophilus TaxID=51669 RepID=UPI000B92BE43